MQMWKADVLLWSETSASASASVSVSASSRVGGLHADIRQQALELK